MEPADILDLIHDDDSGEWDAAHADLLNLSAHSSGESESGGSSMHEDEAADDDEGPPHSDKVSMMMRARDVGPGFVCDQLQEKIELLGNLLTRVEALGNDQHTAPPMELQERREEKIIGLAKLSARITTEKKNLTKVHARLVKLCSSTPRSEDEINSVLVPARTSLLSSSHSTLEVIVHCAEVEPDVVGVCVPISAIHGGKRHDGPNLEVDVISRRGLRWVKVRAASTRSLTTELQHDGDNPRDTKFVELIHEYVRRAKQTRLPFLQIPQVLVVFRCQAPSALVQQLTSIPEVAVCNCAPLNSAHTPLMPRLAYDASFVCFDATALVALTSSTCFRSSRYTVEERLERLASYKVLCEQQRREMTEHAITDFIEVDVRRHTRWLSLEEAMARAREMLPDALLSPSSSLGDVETRPLYRPDLEFLTRLMDYAFVDEDGEAMPSEEVCHSEVVLEAHSRMEAGEACPNWFITDATLAEFQWILETIAGPTELRRAHMLLSCLFIVGTRTLQTLPGMKDTKDGPSKLLDPSTDLITNVQHISTSGNVSRRNRIVFGAADALHAITITSNRQVVNTARDQGIHLLVGLHPSRSLTEQKVLRLRRRSGPLLPPSLD